MENNLSNDNIIHLKKNNKNPFNKNKDKINLTVCFGQCDCECHKNSTQNNSQDPLFYSSTLPHTHKLNSNNNIISKQIKKEYSFDYYNNNTDINPKLTKESIDNKIYLYSKSDINFDGKAEEFITKESLFSNQGYELSKNSNKNKNEFNNDYLLSNENDYILYRNDIKDFNQYLKTLHEIKKGGRSFHKSSSAKNFKLNNPKLYLNNIINNKVNDFKYNISKGYLVNPTKNNNIKKNINISNNQFYKNTKKINFNNNNKLNRHISLDNKFNNKNLKDINYGNKSSQMRKNRSVLFQSNANNNIIKNTRRAKNDLIYKNSSNDIYDTKNTTYRINTYYNQNNKNNNYKLYYYKEDIIKDDYNELLFNNDKNIQEEKSQTKRSNEINNNVKPLDCIVDNFVSMLKYKKGNKSKVLKTNSYSKNNNSVRNKYNDNIMKKKKNLDNMCLSNTPLYNNYNYDCNSKKYPIIEKKIKKNNSINNNINNKNIKSKNDKKGKKKVNDKNKKNGKNERKINNNEYLFKGFPSIYDNNKLYKFAKYQKGRKINISEENKNKYKIPINRNENINSYEDGNKSNFNHNLVNSKLNKGFNDKNLIKYNLNYNIPKKENNFEIEKFDIIIQDKQKNRFNDKNYNKNDIKIFELQLSPSNLNKNIEIQNLSNLSYYPTPKKFYNTTNNWPIKQNNNEQDKILDNSMNSKDKGMKDQRESVSDKIRKLINQKAKTNSSYISLSSKLNLDTNLSLTEENETQNDNNSNTIKRNIATSSKTIFTIFHNYEKPLILAFDIENKTFSFQDFSDFGNFEENYRLSLNNYENKNHNSNNGNIFITIGTNLYIVTGKNRDIFYMYDSIKKIIIKLCKLKNNHSNGNLLYYNDNNSIICLSGDFNKKVEMYSINKNEWTDLPEMIIERSNSSSCIFNIKENKYIINLFGYNSPSKEYLNTIEYLDLNKKNSRWNFLKYNNLNLISLYLSNFFCINYDDDKIILIGGYNGKSNKYNDKFIQIVFEGDIKGNINAENIERKLKDIDMNKKYFFCNGNKYYYNKDKSEIFYEIFDSEFDCHLFEKPNMTHDIFYFYC